MTLTVVCLFVRGEFPYTVDYVRRLRAMVERYCDQPFRFICLTDQPGAMPPGVQPIEIQKSEGCFALWSKLQVFNPAHGFTGRMLYLDLDTLIVAPLQPIIDYASPFALTQDELLFERSAFDIDRYGRLVVRRFNSSVMVWDAGIGRELFQEWTPAAATTLSTDQDWIGVRYPDATALPYEWFPRISRVQPPWPAEAKVVLAKKPKNHIAAAQWPWFDAEWGGWAAA